MLSEISNKQGLCNGEWALAWRLVSVHAERLHGFDFLTFMYDIPEDHFWVDFP